MRNVSIVIPNWNGYSLLPEFFPSVLAAAKHYEEQYSSDIEIIVVDDASTDGSPQWLKDNYGQEPLLKIVEQEHNLGFLPTVNNGFATARYEIVYLLNNDVKVSIDCIAPLVRHFDDEDVFAVSSKAFRLTLDLDGGGKPGRFERGFWRVFENYDIFPTRMPKQTEKLYSFFASGAYAAFDAAKFSRLGGLCSLFAPIYWDDVDICYRAWKRGWTVLYEPASVVYHLSSATMGKKEHQRRVKVVSERNRLIMTWINLHNRLWLTSHIAWLTIKLVGAAFSLNYVYWKSFLQAAACIPDIRRLRRRERLLGRRSDREISAIFERVIASPWVRVMLNIKDYPSFVEMREQLEREDALANSGDKSFGQHGG